MKTIWLLFAVFLISGKLFAQQLDSFEIQSRFMPHAVKGMVYIPKEIKSKNNTALYLLHGAFGNHKQWLQEGNLKNIIDSFPEFKNCIIIMPDAGMTYYMNDSNRAMFYEDFFIKELMPIVEAKFNCGAQKNKRIIAGLSMGGFGALLYSFHHPDLFAGCFAFSPGIRTNDEIIQMNPKEYALRYGPKYANEPLNRIHQHWNKNSILYLVDTMNIQDLSNTFLYIDIGDDDFLWKGNSLLYSKLKERKIPFEFSVRDGEHNWIYWQQSLKLALPIMQKFIQP